MTTRNKERPARHTAAAVCLLLVALAACGESGSQAGRPTPAPEVGGLTVSSSGCVYEGASTHASGAVTLHLVDQTGGGFNAYTWLLDSGYPYSDWAHGFLTDHSTLRDHARMVDHASVKPGATQKVVTWFYAGTIGFLCVPLRDGAEYGVGYTAGPVSVTS
jgi:hypothetical protein